MVCITAFSSSFNPLFSVRMSGICFKFFLFTVHVFSSLMVCLYRLFHLAWVNPKPLTLNPKPLFSDRVVCLDVGTLLYGGDEPIWLTRSLLLLTRSLFLLTRSIYLLYWGDEPIWLVLNHKQTISFFFLNIFFIKKKHGTSLMEAMSQTSSIAALSVGSLLLLTRSLLLLTRSIYLFDGGDEPVWDVLNHSNFDRALHSWYTFCKVSALVHYICYVPGHWFFRNLFSLCTRQCTSTCHCASAFENTSRCFWEHS